MMRTSNWMEFPRDRGGNMGVSKNRATVPENGWFIMEKPIEVDYFGGTIFFGNTHIESLICHQHRTRVVEILSRPP